MAELGDLLVALHASDGAFRSVASRWRVLSDRGRIERAMLAGGSLVGVVDARDVDAVAEEEQVRFWMTGAGQRREERHDAGPDVTVEVVDGDRWWTYSRHTGAQFGEGRQRMFFGEPEEITILLAPAPLLGLLRFEVTGETERIGRPVICARARPASGQHDCITGLDSLGVGADEFLLEVDRERGVIVRLESRIGGETMVVREALELEFDVDLDPGLFMFVAPDGTEPVAIGPPPSLPVGLTLEDAAARVPFGIYALPETPSGWELTVLVLPIGDRPHQPSITQLVYRSADFTAQLTIQLSPSGHDEGLGSRDTRVPEEIERADRTMHVRRATADWPQTQVRLRLDDTTIALGSTTMSAERLIDIATRLVRIGE